MAVLAIAESFKDRILDPDTETVIAVAVIVRASARIRDPVALNAEDADRTRKKLRDLAAEIVAAADLTRSTLRMMAATNEVDVDTT